MCKNHLNMALTPDKIREIEGKAHDVLVTACGNVQIKPPVDLSKIIALFNMKIKQGNFGRSDISGAYDKKNRTIYVAQSDPYSRKAFTIAHEIGHYVLHEDKEMETFFRVDALKFGGKKPDMEQEADWFAASLLMPKKIVERFWVVTYDVERMARLFSVSYSAMDYRLKNLDLID